MENVLLDKPELFSFKETLWFLDRGFDDCLHKVEGKSVIKAIRHQNDIMLFEIKDHDEFLDIRILNGSPGREQISYVKNYVRNWFDLERDLSDFYTQAQNNVITKSLIDQYPGLRLIMIPDLFEAICWCIIGQQINLTFAHKLKTGMVHKYGEHISHHGIYHYVFPKPEILAQLDIEDLKALQFSKQKADYVIQTARKFMENEAELYDLNTREQTSEIITELCRMRGVGEWTANYVCMKTFKRTDCITYGDAGLLNGLKSLQNLKAKPTREEINSFFRQFKGWESYVVFYIWRSLT